MAKYDVKFSCGHEETVELFGATDDRRKKIAYYERSGLCSCCYAAAESDQRIQKQKCKEELAAVLPAEAIAKRGENWFEPLWLHRYEICAAPAKPQAQAATEILKKYC